MAKRPNGNGFGDSIRRLRERFEDPSISENVKERIDAIIRDTKGLPISQRHERLLSAARILREHNRLSGPEEFFFIAGSIVRIVEDRIFTPDQKDANPVLDEIGAKINEVERAHGLEEDEFWLRGEGPPDYEELQAAWSAAYDKIVVATFDEFGEPEYGQMYLSNREEFDERFEAGRKLIHG